MWRFIRLSLFSTLLFFALALPVLVAAQEVTTTSTTVVAPDASYVEAAKVFGELAIKAFKEKNWAVFSGLLLMALIWVAERIKLLDKLKLNGEPRAWAIAGIATLGSVGLGLYSGQHWDTILWTGLTVGLVAIGGWNTIGKLAERLGGWFIGLFKKKS